MGSLKKEISAVISTDYLGNLYIDHLTLIIIPIKVIVFMVIKFLI